MRQKKKVLAPPRLRNSPLFLALLAVKKKKKSEKFCPVQWGDYKNSLSRGGVLRCRVEVQEGDLKP